MPPRCLRQLLTLAVLALPARLYAQAPTDTLRVGVLLSPAPGQRAHSTSIARGIELGVEEAARTAALFGLIIQLARGTELNASGDAVTQLLDARASAIILAGDSELCATLLEARSRRSLLFLTLDCRYPIQRIHPCARRVFHLGPSDPTRARARDLVSGAPKDASAGERLTVWHHTLSRFGAEQLNDRFRRRFGVEMDSAAWTSWLAVKIIAETALRARTTQGTKLAHYLVRRDTRFDGHKGEPLTFDPLTGELRQTLYDIVDGTAGQEHIAAELTSRMLFPQPATARREPSECAAQRGPPTP